MSFLLVLLGLSCSQACKAKGKVCAADSIKTQSVETLGVLWGDQAQDINCQGEIGLECSPIAPIITAASKCYYYKCSSAEVARVDALSLPDADTEDKRLCNAFAPGVQRMCTCRDNRLSAAGRGAVALSPLALFTTGLAATALGAGQVRGMGWAAVLASASSLLPTADAHNWMFGPSRFAVSPHALQGPHSLLSCPVLCLRQVRGLAL